MANDGTKITAPVSMTDIATVIGDSTNMGASENVNIWSKNKPYEAHDKHYEVQTGNDRLRNAYGFYWWNVSQEADAPFATSASALMDKALANKGEWKWKKPVTTQRMGDFDGYNHNAHLPYDTSVYILGSANKIHGLIRAWDADAALGYDEDVDLKASDMPAVGGANVIAGFDTLMLVRQVGGSSVTVVSESNGMTVEDVDDGNDAYFLFEAPSTDGEVAYEVVLAASDINRNYWMYYPYGIGVVTTDSVLSAFFMSFRPLDISGVKIEPNDDTTIMDMLKISLRIVNNMGSSITVAYTIRLWIDGNYDSTVNEYNSSIIVGGNTYNAIERADLYPNDDGTIGQVKMTIDLNYIKTGDSQWNYCKYDFREKKIVSGNSTEDDGVTIQEIAEIESA